MSETNDDGDTLYTVVMNHEEQYSIWPAGRPLPAGWQAVGMTGTRAACLEHIKAIWTDMRPLSARQKDAASRMGDEQ